MKLLKFFCAYALLVMFASCTSSVGNSNFESEDQIETRSEINRFVRNGVSYVAGDISVTCGDTKCTGGNIGPSDNCQLGSDMNGNVECSCSGCKMTIFTKDLHSDDDIKEQLRIDNNHENANKFVFDKHNEVISGFNSITYNFSVERTTASYEYSLSNGDVETVLYVTNYDSQGLVKEKFEIDCTGTCGCREQFNLNTGLSSCSCDPCKMVVTKLDDK